MTSVVNKSKNKFAPKAKIRTRTITSITPTPKERQLSVPSSSNAYHIGDNITPISPLYPTSNSLLDERSSAIPTLLEASRSQFETTVHHCDPLIAPALTIRIPTLKDQTSLDSEDTTAFLQQRRELPQALSFSLLNKQPTLAGRNLDGHKATQGQSVKKSGLKKRSVSILQKDFSRLPTSCGIQNINESLSENLIDNQYSKTTINKDANALVNNKTIYQNLQVQSQAQQRMQLTICNTPMVNNAKFCNSSSRQRQESPLDTEDRTIEENSVKMKDLIRDPGIGRKSKQFTELTYHNKNGRPRVRKAYGSRHELDHRETSIFSINEISDATIQPKSISLEVSTPQTRIVNGQIVIDEESLRIDRHQRDAPEEKTMEVVEENQSTRIINSSTWSNKERGEKWDNASTERYYKALSMFGTDFEMMAKLFPGRSRRMIKNKFNCEERKHPERVTLALRTRISVDLREYSDIADIQFGEVEDLAAELQRLREQYIADSEQLKLQAVQLERERQENANAAMRAEDEIYTHEQTKKRKKKNKGIGSTNEEILKVSIEEYEAQRLRTLQED